MLPENPTGDIQGEKKRAQRNKRERNGGKEKSHLLTTKYMPVMGLITLQKHLI